MFGLSVRMFLFVRRCSPVTITARHALHGDSPWNLVVGQIPCATFRETTSRSAGEARTEARKLEAERRNQDSQREDRAVASKNEHNRNEVTVLTKAGRSRRRVD
jgi:hypothetical protein